MASIERTIFDLESIKAGLEYNADIINDYESATEIISNAQEWLKKQQAEIELLKKGKDEAYSKGFTDGQNNMLEAETEGR